MTADRLLGGEARYTATQLDIERTLHFLTPADRELCIPMFKNKGAVTGRLFEESLPGFMIVLELAKASYAVKRDCVFKLAEMNTRFGSVAEYRQFFSGVIHIFSELGRQQLVCDSTVLALVLDSANKHSYTFVIENNEYPTKLLQSALAYANSSQWSEEKLLDAVDPTAVRLSENAIHGLGARIVQIIKSHVRELAVSPRTGEIETQKTDGRASKVQSEFLTSEYGAEYVRVGELFFINAKYKDLLPPEISRYGNSNIIFVHDMHHTELSDRLGYYTVNTIASVLSTDVAGKVVLDCGAGSGLLALVALKLGAAAVLAVEYDAALFAQARENAAANNYVNDDTFTVLQSDLRDVSVVVEQLRNNAGADREVVILTNVGSWENYPITNLTSYSYIPAIASSPGLSVSKVISGGYSHGVGGTLPLNEVEFLQAIGVEHEQLPGDAKLRDIRVLQHLGTHQESDTFSQRLLQPGSFPHEASSMVMSK